jgi:hypothetical protein
VDQIALIAPRYPEGSESDRPPHAASHCSHSKEATPWS